VETFAAHRFAEAGHQIPLGANLDGVPRLAPIGGGFLAGPEGEAIVVF